MSPVLLSRQNFNDGNDGDFAIDDNRDHNGWWYSPTAAIVKWSILAGIVLFFVAWFVIGHYHAKARVRKGLAPLWYHRFLVPPHQRGPMKQRGPQNQFTFYRVQEEGYAMDSMPPPSYNPNGMPPTYQPPEGATKAAPDQSYDVPPPGPPPGQTLPYDIPPPGAPPGELPPREPKKKQGWASKASNISPFKRS